MRKKPQEYVRQALGISGLSRLVAGCWTKAAVDGCGTTGRKPRLGNPRSPLAWIPPGRAWSRLSTPPSTP